MNKSNQIIFIGLRSSKYYFKRPGRVVGYVGSVIWVGDFDVGRCVVRNGLLEEVG